MLPQQLMSHDVTKTARDVIKTPREVKSSTSRDLIASPRDITTTQLNMSFPGILLHVAVWRDGG